MIQVDGLVHRYGRLLAVDGLSFEVARGEFVGLLGPNGAGKSTTMKAICGLLAPSEGGVRVGGHDVQGDPLAARRQLGYLPETVPLWPELSVRESLRYAATAKGVPRDRLAAEVDRLVEACGLGEVRDRLVGRCSRGYRQRTGLALALAGDPPALVLDEPTSGLDPEQLAGLRGRIAELASDKAVLLSTHVLPEAERLCSRVLIVQHGRLRAEGDPSSLAAGTADRRRQRLLVRAGAPAAATLAGSDRVAQAEPGPAPAGYERFTLELAAAPDVPGLLSELAAAGVAVEEIRPDRGALEEAFVGLVREEAGA